MLWPNFGKQMNDCLWEEQAVKDKEKIQQQKEKERKERKEKKTGHSYKKHSQYILTIWQTCLHQN